METGFTKKEIQTLKIDDKDSDSLYFWINRMQEINKING